MLRVLTLATLFPNGLKPTLGGFVELQTRALAARDGVEVEVVAPIGLPAWPLSLHPHYAPLNGLPREEVRNGLKVHRPRYRVWPMIGAAGTARRMAHALLPVLRAIRTRFCFDVIDAEFFWPDGPAAMRLARALDVPFSIKARGSDIHVWGARPATAAQIAAAGRAADGLLAVSGALRADMAALGMPEDKIRVHHTGIDLGRFRPAGRAAAKAALGVEGPLLVCAGALLARKGQDLAIAALGQLPGATLILVGDGPDRARLEGLAKGARVRFLGNRPHAELPGLLAAADVMVLPTVSEGLANVWVEALACGTPVVTSDVGGAREVIDRPEAGRLVARDPAAIAGAVRDLLAVPPDQAAVRKGAERFSWEKNGAELFDHLQSIRHSRESGSPDNG
ncbi:MAG TPA: glycosyltransferase [Allosphingosinicella sp.]|nr:glycosyltransferase [Allosphingosinicella sp.]